MYGHTYKQQRDLTDLEWEAITYEFVYLIGHLPKSSRSGPGRFGWHPLGVADGNGKTGSVPVVNETSLAFNGYSGWGQLHHDVFFVTKLISLNRSVEDCQTSGKPYDLVVCATLLLMHFHAPGAWQIGSDGGYEEWDQAIQWIEQTLGVFPMAPWLDKS